jgi:hypothetical protein
MQWPGLRLRHDIRFEHGFFTADSKDKADLIESCESFGRAIHPIKWEPTAVPVVQGKVEEMIESEIANELAARQPKARRGGIGTR